MGVTISKDSALAPISLASTIIGFISFAFTIATLIRVFWDNLSTFMTATTQISDTLTNLRQSLYEEQMCLRRARQHLRQRRRSATVRGMGPTKEGRAQDEMRPEASLAAMAAAIRHLIQQFKAMERPFLEKGIESDDKLFVDRRNRRRRRSDKEDEAAIGYSSGIGEDEEADYLFAENRYRECGMRERLLWIRYKNSAIGLMNSVARMEVRRIGLQVSHIGLQAREWDRHWEEFDIRLDALDRMEQRLGRVVGVRRVE